jgi:hypothetical protein
MNKIYDKTEHNFAICITKFPKIKMEKTIKPTEEWADINSWTEREMQMVIHEKMLSLNHDRRNAN